MMGHRDKLKTGEELDLVTSVRRLLKYAGRSGVCSRVKNAINRRARRNARAEIEERASEELNRR